MSTPTSSGIRDSILNNWNYYAYGISTKPAAAASAADDSEHAHAPAGGMGLSRTPDGAAAAGAAVEAEHKGASATNGVHGRAALPGVEVVSNIAGLHLVGGVGLFLLSSSVVVAASVAFAAYVTVRELEFRNNKLALVHMPKAVAVSAALNAIYYGAQSTMNPLFVLVAVGYFVAFKYIFDTALKNEKEMGAGVPDISGDTKRALEDLLGKAFTVISGYASKAVGYLTVASANSRPESSSSTTPTPGSVSAAA